MTELRPNPRDRAIRRLLAILVGGALPVASATVLSLDGEWLLAVDPQNVGREQKWCDGPVAQAKSAKVPWIIQEAFPGYHGVAVLAGFCGAGQAAGPRALPVAVSGGGLSGGGVA